jgi:hypothetical protein
MKNEDFKSEWFTQEESLNKLKWDENKKTCFPCFQATVGSIELSLHNSGRLPNRS